jgi:Ca2+-dependent lipid-binding protein
LEDYYSRVVKGSNPVWNYFAAIDLLYNDDLKDYLRRNDLQLVVLDDNAVISGEGDADVVGSARVSLAPLLENKNINEQVSVVKAGSRVGQLDVKISWFEQEGDKSEVAQHEVARKEVARNAETEFADIDRQIGGFVSEYQGTNEDLFGTIDTNKTGVINFE